MTNAVDLEPGSVFRVEAHPHPELDGRDVLVVAFSIDGSPDDAWTMAGQAVFAAAPYRPKIQTPKPRIKSLQSATVVGPRGQEIHTDELGRVRVQFPWDREGKSDDGSSCWVRVSQGWSGLVYGEIMIPRIGQEVLVEFLQGNPDQPMVTGRLFNATQPVPYRLPEHKTRSAWKSDSSLGSAGFNEIMYEDLKGQELVWEQAQKDRQKLVKNDERSTIGHDRQKTVKNDERDQISGDHKRLIEKESDIVIKAVKREKLRSHSHVRLKQDHRERIDGKDSLVVAMERHEHIEENDALDAGSDIHLFAGTEMVFEAPDITLKSPGGFIRLDGSGVTIVGTLVRINDGGAPGTSPDARPDLPEEPEDPAGKTWIEITLHSEDEPHDPIPSRATASRCPTAPSRRASSTRRARRGSRASIPERVRSRSRTWTAASGDKARGARSLSMAGMHTLEQGESLSTLARQNGLQSFRTIWDHPGTSSCARIEPRRTSFTRASRSTYPTGSSGRRRRRRRTPTASSPGSTRPRRRSSTSPSWCTA